MGLRLCLLCFLCLLSMERRFSIILTEGGKDAFFTAWGCQDAGYTGCGRFGFCAGYRVGLVFVGRATAAFLRFLLAHGAFRWPLAFSAARSGIDKASRLRVPCPYGPSIRREASRCDQTHAAAWWAACWPLIKGCRARFMGLAFNSFKKGGKDV